MIRALPAVAGVATFIVGLAGATCTASASPGHGIIQQANVVINEVAAELDTIDVEGGYVKIKNIGDTAQDIGGWVVTGCTASESFSITIPAGTTLEPGETYIVADDNYIGLVHPPDQTFSSGSKFLQVEGGALLEDDSTLRIEIDEIAWVENGTPAVSCAGTDAGVVPTDDMSIHRGSPWFLDSPW